MASLVVGEHPEFDAWLTRRRAEGLDGRDEVWDGVYRVAPHEHGRHGIVMMSLASLLAQSARAAGLKPGGSFNLGRVRDYRVPDLGYHRVPIDPVVYFSTAALVVEVLSPDDESVAKLPFYAAHDVDEVWLVDPLSRSVDMRLLSGSDYVAASRSPLLGLTAAELEEQIDWS